MRAMWRTRPLLLCVAALLLTGLPTIAVILGFGAGSERAARLLEAERALRASRLTGEAGAVALFLAVLAEEPDHELARRGVQRAGEQALAAAEEAAARGERAQALLLLDAARDAGVADVRLEEVRTLLRNLDPGRQRLLEEAAQAHVQGDPPIELLARLVAAVAEDRGDAELARRLERLLDQRAGLAAAWLGAGDVERARRELETLQALAAEHPIVVALEAAMLAAERERRREGTAQE